MVVLLYVCPKCRKKFKETELQFIGCAYCGNKVLFKETPPTVKVVKAE